MCTLETQIEEIEQVTTFKYLGIKITSDMQLIPRNGRKMLKVEIISGDLRALYGTINTCDPNVK